MSHSEPRPCVGNVTDELKNYNIADRFAAVMVHLNLEYELEPDVLSAAEDVLRILTPKAEKRAEGPHEVACHPPRLDRIRRRDYSFGLRYDHQTF
jgi:hypothetical protein